MYSVAEGTKSDGEYVIHTRSPRCVGRVERIGGKVRVYMHAIWEPLDSPEAERKMCLDMKNWFFFKYVQPGH